MADGAATTIVLCLGVSCSAINIILVLLVVLNVRRSSLIHANCKFLAYSAAFAFLCMSCGNVVMCAVTFSPYCPLPEIEQLSDPQATCKFVRYIRIIMFYGVMLVGYISLATCAERTFATLLSDYEQSSRASVGVPLLVLAHSAALATNLAYWLWGLAHYLVCATIVLANFAAFLYALVLRKANNRRNNVRAAADGHLSIRYQLSENLRVIDKIWPCMLLSCVAVGGITAIFAYWQYTSLQELSILLYSLLLNVYVTVCCCLLGRDWLLTLICRRRSRVASTRIDVDTHDGHFQMMKHMWQ